MINFEKFTNYTQEIIFGANAKKDYYKNTEVQPEHIILAMIEDKGISKDYLQELKLLNQHFIHEIVAKIKKIKVHPVMEAVGTTIFETCKTYLIQQGKFLVLLEVFIAICIGFYFGVLQHMGLQGVLTILAWSVIGILGSYGVAWFGIRMNTLANARSSFVALEGKPLKILGIPLKVGMSIGVLLVSVELIMMLII